MQRQIYYNGNILTQDKRKPKATAFALENKKYIAVGNDNDILQLKNDETEIIDLQNKTVLPGFNDAHIHIWKVGNLMTYTLDLRGVQSVEEMLDKINDYHKNNPQLKWIQARGFNEANFPDKRIPNKNDLDKITTEKPICVTRTCAHQIVVNSKALEIAELSKSTQTPAGGEIKLLPNGELAGHFTETAIGLILNKIPKYSKEELRTMVLAAQNEFIKLGITSATDPAVDKELLEVYKEMDKNGQLKIRINLFPIRIPDGTNKIYPLPEFYSSEHLKVNTIKFFADGGLSGKTAALKNPYKDSSEYGVLRLEKENFKKLTKESQDAGFRIATHAIGDAAIEMVLEVLNEISVSNKNNINHRIEHLGLPSEHDLWLMKELNISAVMQPVFIYELGKNFKEYLNDEYLNYVYPAKSVLEHGINLAFSTDAPVVKDFNPLTNIQSAMNRKDTTGFEIEASQKINFNDALYAYTIGSAIANGDEKEI
ncbi:MAG: amidohydrolase, partial [Fimbriimonadaceae bacterium]|nr:amidohydrolase [Chitinophagales bacterium]